VNEWAYSFWPNFDIQLESKAKNLARDQFYAQFSGLRAPLDSVDPVQEPEAEALVA
jgi:hypothetical protein